MRLIYLLVIATIATPAASQELEFVFDDELSFELSDEEPASGMELSTTLGVTRAGIGVLTDTWAAQIDAANQHDLGALGYLEWAANAYLPDLENGAEIIFDLSRIHLQNSAGDLSWKLGKYRIGWGEIEGAPVLDVVNGGLSFGDIGLSSDELPGQWFAGLDYFASAATFSGFVGVDLDVAHMMPAIESDEIEVGAKAMIPINDGSVSLYAAQLLPQTGVVDLGAGTSHSVPFVLTGISANKSVGNVLLEFDLAGKFGLQRSTLTELSSQDRIDASIGFEFAPTNTMQVTAAVAGQHWLEQTETYYELGGYVADQTTGNYIVGLSDTLMDGKLSVSANLLGTLDSTVGVTSLSATYSYSDAVKFGASAMWMDATAGTPFESMDGFTQYGLTSTFHF